MTIGGAFLGGGVELVPAGSCKLVLEIRTEDGQNLATTFSVVGGGQTYTATAGSDGRAELTVPSGVTYTVTTSATGYDGLTAQTVIGDSATVQYVRFEATLPRVKKSGDTITGDLGVQGIVRMVNGNLGAMARVGGNASGGKWYKVASLKPIGSQYVDVHMVLAHYDTYAYGNNPTQRVGILNVHVRRSVETVSGELRFMIAGPNVDVSRYALVTYSDFSAELYVQQQNSYGFPNFVRLDANTSRAYVWTLYRENISVDSLDTLGGTITYASKPVILPPEFANENSNAPATTSWVNMAPTVVHTTGNETIAGVKTFSNPAITTQYTGFHVKNANLTKGNGANSSNVNMFMGFHDKNDTGVNLSYNLGGLRYTVPVGTSEKPANVFVELSNQYYRDVYLRLYDNGIKCYATAPSTPTNANSNEIATADWVNSKLSSKNKKTEFTSWAELEALIKAGKRGDSFNLTMDFTGLTAISGATSSSATVHAFGHYHVDEITVSGGAITKAEMFGSGEVQFKVDGTTKTFATTGFGRKVVTTEPVWGFRVPQNGMLGYAVINKDEVTSCKGYYISI